MAIEGVMRVGQVQLRVMDMDAAVRHYTEYIGLQEVCRDATRVYLKAWDEFRSEGVMRVGQVQLRVMDMDAAVRHYTEYIGLQEVCRDATRVYLKAWDEF